jgi:hypothetical protein
MKRENIIGFGIASATALTCIGLGISTVNAQSTATASANATANILDAVSIIGITDLEFGTNVASNVAGTVIVDPRSDVSTTGGVTHLEGEQAATFTVTGPISQICTLDLPTAISVTSTTNNADTMIVDTFTSFPDSASCTIGVTGSFTLGIGGTLHVAANQPTGFYTGTFDVTVDFAGGGGGGPIPLP